MYGSNYFNQEKFSGDIIQKTGKLSLLKMGSFNSMPIYYFQIKTTKLSLQDSFISNEYEENK